MTARDQILRKTIGQIQIDIKAEFTNLYVHSFIIQLIIGTNLKKSYFIRNLFSL